MKMHGNHYRALFAVALLMFGCTTREAPQPKPKEPVAKEPVLSEATKAVLELAKPTPKDKVYVLGSGDGQLAVAAAKEYGASVVAVDAKPTAEAALAAEKAGVANRVTFLKEGVEQADLSEATLIILPGSEGVTEALEQKLKTKLTPGTRIVSYVHKISGWRPEAEQAVKAGGGEQLAFLYAVPASASPSSLAPFVPTPMPVVEKMVEMAGITKDDVVYDLGCGDGRIVVEAAKKSGARAVGVDFDIRRCEEARDRAKRENVANLVEIRNEDIMKTDFSNATVVTLYLLPSSNRLLKPKLLALKAGARIVSHDFSIEGWEPLRKENVNTGTDQHTIYLWEVGKNSPKE